ncbi:MAG: hypothetical protein AB1652_04720 [Bacillota bacterium]
MGRASNPPHRVFTGVKGSILGREGPKYAIQEMTETRLVVVAVQPALLDRRAGTEKFFKEKRRIFLSEGRINNRAKRLIFLKALY